MNLATVADPRAWIDKSIEAFAALSTVHSIPPETLTWPPDEAVLARMRIRWPADYEWHFRRVLGDQMLAAFRRFVKVDVVKLAQPYQGVITFQLTMGGKSHVINIETSDYPDLNEEAYHNCALHFKQQFRHEGYGLDRIIPGSYLNNDPIIYRYLRWLRRTRDEAPPRYDVTGRFQLRMDQRRTPIDILRQSTGFRFRGGEGKVRYSRYLREIAGSKICVDLPGSANITFRIFDYFAVGACVVGPPHKCRLPVPFIDGEHLVYCREDYSDLEDICVALLRDDAERRRFIRKSRAFFDRYMHRDQLAAYYLHHCITMLT
jgi:hypothetical protein